MLYEVNGHSINCNNINIITKTAQIGNNYGFSLIMKDNVYYIIQYSGDDIDTGLFFDNIFYVESKEEVDSLRRMIVITTR